MSKPIKVVFDEVSYYHPIRNYPRIKSINSESLARTPCLNEFYKLMTCIETHAASKTACRGLYNDLKGEDVLVSR